MATLALVVIAVNTEDPVELLPSDVLDLLPVSLFSSALRLPVAQFLAIKALSPFQCVFFRLRKEGVHVAAELRYMAMFFCNNLVCNPLAAEVGRFGAC
jgi:hypothetical protein